LLHGHESLGHDFKVTRNATVTARGGEPKCLGE
jgi:hypothetical protein